MKYKKTPLAPSNWRKGRCFSRIMEKTLATTVLFLVKLNKGLSQLRPSTRMWQLVISFIGLFAFPIGTLFYGVVFFTFLFHKKTKEAFEGAKTKEID